MKTQHTKGTWQLQKDNCIINIDGGAIICQMGSADNNDIQKDANAKLIAAAPELLDALTEVQKLLELTPYDNLNLQDLVNNAIIKASK